MKEYTPQQAALMALIEQYAAAKARTTWANCQEQISQEIEAEAQEAKALKAVEAAICAPQAEVVWPEPVAWRVHPHDYGIGTEGVHAITQLQHQRTIWARKDWKPEPLYTREQVEAMLAQQKGQA